MEETQIDDLIDSRRLSKTRDALGRISLAEKLLDNRKKLRAESSELRQQEIEQEQITDLISSNFQAEIELLNQLSDLVKKFSVRAKAFLGVSDRRITDINLRIESLRQESNSLREKIELDKQNIEQRKQKLLDIPSAKKLIDEYYEGFDILPLTLDQKRQLLTPEVLSQLSMEEYIALWRKLNPYFLSHVTRQGFRDHNAMFYHQAGMMEFHDGFYHILTDAKKLRPPLAIKDLKTRNPEDVKEFLSQWVLLAENEEDANIRLSRLLNFSLASAPNYPDKTAVHFANQVVADSFYGGEFNNEIFMVFPADYIASQYLFAFNGWEKDFTKPQSETKWNDIFVWPNSLQDPGISVDSGIVFLPKSAQVDPETGSKYFSTTVVVDGENKRVMTKDAELVDRFTEWAKSLGNNHLVMSAYKAYMDEGNYYARLNLENTLRLILIDETMQLGFNHEAAENLSYEVMSKLAIWQGVFSDELIEQTISTSTAMLKRADTTISAKLYWEQYFVKNPEQKPKHIYYYDGSPTVAVYEFMQKNKIGSADTSSFDGKLLGFDDNHVNDMEKDRRAYNGYDELIKTSQQIIHEHYAVALHPIS